MRDLPAGGFLDEPVSLLFPGDLNGGWVEATTEEGPGIVGFVVVEFPAARTLLGFNAVSDATSRRLFSAQYATDPGTVFTELNLVNIGRSRRHVTITAVLNNGQRLADPVPIELEAGESFTRDAAELFPDTPSLVGSLKVEVDGEGVVGGVIFGDSASLRFAAAVALQPRAFTRAIFSQVANVPGVFFTGLAFFYPENDTAAPDVEIQIQVVRADGQTVGTVSRTLKAGQRVAALVEELVPAARGQAGGYIRITSSRPVVSQILFGSLANGLIQLFSAVPPAEL